MCARGWRWGGGGGWTYEKPFQPIPGPTFANENHAHSCHVTACDKKRRCKLSNSKGLARKLVKRLIQENEKGRPWREIAGDYPMLNADGKPIVKAGTLSRIAKGKYMPSKENILAALGLYKPRPPYPRPSWLFKWYHKPKDERYAVMRSHVENGHDDEERLRQKKETRKIMEWIPE